VTREVIVDLIWRGLGKPTHLDPSSDRSFVDGNDQTGPMLTHIVNLAQRKIASWKNNGRRCKIHSLIGEMFFRSHTYTVSPTSDINNETFPYYIEVDNSGGTIGTDDNQYSGWILQDAHNEVQIITNVDGDGGSSEYPKLFYANAF
jgi:hypothetical protein